MGKNSRIEWTRHTFNPWWGCTKVSGACKHCYAEAWSTRVGQRVWGAKAKRRFFAEGQPAFANQCRGILKPPRNVPASERGSAALCSRPRPNPLQRDRSVRPHPPPARIRVRSHAHSEDVVCSCMDRARSDRRFPSSLCVACSVPTSTIRDLQRESPT